MIIPTAKTLLVRCDVLDHVNTDNKRALRVHKHDVTRKSPEDLAALTASYFLGCFPCRTVPVNIDVQVMGYRIVPRQFS
jgi:hypothetical protein